MCCQKIRQKVEKTNTSPYLAVIALNKKSESSKSAETSKSMERTLKLVGELIFSASRSSENREPLMLEAGVVNVLLNVGVSEMVFETRRVLPLLTIGNGV